jgi:hypothetical protein
MKKLSWTAGVAWSQSLILGIALLAAGITSYRERGAAQERQTRRLGSALLTELRDSGGEPALAESLFHANEQLAYLKVRQVENQVDLAWYRSQELAGRGECPPPPAVTERVRSCRPLDARLVDVQVRGLAPGDILQAGLWVSGGPRPAGVLSAGELWAWLVVAVCGLALAFSLAWRQGHPLRELSRRAGQLAEVIPPAHRPLYQDHEWGTLEQTLESLGKELKLHKIQLAKAHQVLGNRRAEGRRELRLALGQKEQEAEQEKRELSRSLAELKMPLRHLAQMSRVLEQRVGEGLPPEDQGRLRRLSRESEKALHRLLEIETELKLVLEREPAEQLNLSELIWKLGPEWEAAGIRIQLVNPLPTLWLPRPRMERLFRELIQAAAGERVEKRKAVVEVGYANLRDRLAFFVKGARGAGIRKFSETAASWARHALQPYRGMIWVEYQPEQGGIIYFTLAKDALAKTAAAAAELAEAA